MKDLLLQLCQYPFDPSKKDLLKELLNQVQDWKKTVELINAHGIIALASYNIRQAGLENEISPFAMTAIDNGYHQSIVRNIWLKERWKEVNEILSKAGLKHILLKGMALEYTHYNASGLRQMSDCDILIRREEALKTWNLLQASGFKTKTIKSPLHNRIISDLGKHLPTLYKEDFAVEIHIRLFNTKLQDEDLYNRIFDRSPEIAIDNIKAFVLPDDTQLNYLLHHFEKHKSEGECQLRLYRDITLLDKNTSCVFPDMFISDPSQSRQLSYRKAAYRDNFHSIPKRFRIRFLLGDLFPSVKWMKERYNCRGVRVFLYYPQRVGKVWWLLG